MRNAYLALAVLAAGCAGGSQPERVTVQHRSQQTELVVSPPTPAPAPNDGQVAPTLRLVGEGEPVDRSPTKPAVVKMQILPQRQAQSQPITTTETDRQKDPQAETYFLQVGPPVVLNTSPTVATTPDYPTYQAPPAAAPSLAPPSPSPTTPVLETAPGFTYQNGGVMGATTPTTSPSPALPTAEGYQYQP